MHTTGQLTNTRRSDETPELDGPLREVDRKKILHYRQLYINHPDPIAFLPTVVDTTGRLYDDFSRLLFLHVHREDSALTNEIQEESDQFRFLRVTYYANIKGSVGLILAKASAMRISIPLDLSSRVDHGGKSTRTGSGRGMERQQNPSVLQISQTIGGKKSKLIRFLR